MNRTAESHHAAGRSRYSRGAILLHWLTAAVVLVMIALAIFNAYNDTAAGDAAINLHKVLGITVLGLTLVRLGWRLTHPAPPLPAHMVPLMRVAARATHGLFYVVLLAMPLSGWWMTSAFPQRHPIDAGLFEVPFLPVPLSMESAGAAHTLHEAGAWVIVSLIAVHVAAALKHHFIDRDEVFQHMLPASRP